ncbi:MAG: hypothetical protein RL291_1677 [Pseudomonadota bacterium]
MANRPQPLPRKASAQPRRVRDTGYTESHFGWDMALVVCPRCQGPARTMPGQRTDNKTDPAKAFTAHKLVCTACSHTRGAGQTEPSSAVGIGGATDAAFGLPFWLTIETRHGLLYAQNLEHLDIIEAFVAGTLRERRLVEYRGNGRNMPSNMRWHDNKTIVSRLPRWVKLAKKRAEVLSALARLRAKASAQS